MLERLSEFSRFGIEVFRDKEGLKPGQEWRPVLEKELKEKDVFYLFWSVNAKQSPYVKWELDTALAYKGKGFIDVHPLDHAADAAPPPELEGLHFDDKFLYYRRS